MYANFARVWLVLALILVWLPRCYAAAPTQSFTTAGGAEIPLLHFPAEGRAAVLWLPSESGVLQQEQQAAAALAKAGVEVWYADLFSAYFLPTLGSSFAKMPPADVAALIEHLRRTTGKRIYLLSAGRGALLALRAAHRWQEEHPRAKPLGGAILISPKLYVRTPEPGLEGQLMPVVTATNLPLLILQPEKSIWRWKMKRIVPALSRGGSDVFVRYLPGVRDRFYYRQDASAAEDAMARRLPALLEHALAMLRTVGGKPRPPVTITAKASGESLAERTDRRLRRFRGDPQPPALRLKGLDGQVHDLAQYRGKVVLVNFWATWCPPCVHEMPSIERLKHKMAGRPFKILAVNMAENRSAVERFLHNVVNVDFTILLDSDGAALSRWKVFAFPTTYVVGRHGRIRYALFGSIEWDNPDVLQKLNRLLRQ